MNAPGSLNHAVAHAVVDADGRLLSAEPAIVTLNRHAGGQVGAMLAVPALATIARLARRLGIVVSRGALVADDEADIRLWVRAQPEGANVRLSISGWHERASLRLPANAAGDTAAIAADADWRWETDAGLRLTFITLEAGARHGFEALAMLGQPLTRLFAFADASDEGGALPILDALARRRAFAGQVATIRGTAHRVTLSAAIRQDAQGDFAGLIGGARLVRATAEAPPPLGQGFTAGLDTALRRPLGRIIAQADSINDAAEGPVEPTYAEYAADIASAGRHLLGLVDDLVDLQAIERADFAPPCEPIDLADVARRGVGLLRVRASDSGVTLAAPAADEEAPAIGDFRRALQILVNLVGNAVRYAPHGSTVTVEVAQRGAMVEASVTDSGKGIAPADQARVFEKFERVDASEPGGNGLGLYIARRLARAMGGDLTLESGEGAGARFTLALPIVG